MERAEARPPLGHQLPASVELLDLEPVGEHLAGVVGELGEQ